MNTIDKIKKFNKWQERLAAYRYALSLINVDMINGAPMEGADYRAKNNASLNGEYRKIYQDEEIYDIICDLLKEEDIDGKTRRELELYYDRLTKERNIPVDLYVDFENVLSQSKTDWLKAKASDDYKSYAPILKDVIDLYKEITSLQDSPLDLYDRMLDDHQRGWNKLRYDAFFDDVRGRILPLLDDIKNSKVDINPVFKGEFDIETQRRVMAKIIQFIGFDSSWGRMGESEHPVTSALSRGDVRFTTKFRLKDPVQAVFSTVHESGHAWFGHNVSDEYEGSIIAGSISSGLHESQSRLCENHLGRSFAFWERVYPWFKEAFPDKFQGVTLHEFYRSINAVKPSLVRTESDEVTYPIHILIRYEIEKALMDDSLSVNDLEDAWNEKYSKYLEVVPWKASEGVLQDMHWPYAYFGYFPTYALGSAMAAQFFDVMSRENDVENLIREDRYKDLMKWLGDNIHQYGNRYEADEILKKVTGEPFNDEFYFKYLENKYRKIYEL